MTITAANGLTALEFDTKLAGLWGEQHEADGKIRTYLDAVHRALGDRYEFHMPTGRHWGMNDDLVLREVKRKAEAGEEIPLRERGTLVGHGNGNKGMWVEVAARCDSLLVARRVIGAQITAMDKLYDQRPWQRYFPCQARNGHIHATLYGCHTVTYNTEMAWRPDLSGHTIEAAVAKLGEALCTHCFPDAPAEYTAKTLTDVERERSAAERAAAKAARDAKTAATKLTVNEQFRTAYNRDLVTTVAACKDLIRKAVEEAVELEYYQSPAAPARWTGDAESLARVTRNVAASLVMMQADATQAERVLLARETAHDGWGATATEITTMRARKEKTARKAWGV